MFSDARTLLLTLLLALGATAGVAGEEVRETVLPNGLKVLTKEIHAAPVVSVWTYYRAGSRNERPGITGISHQIEHMMFKGTATFQPGEIDRQTALAGGKNNAFTDTDYTSYYFAMPSDAAAPPGHSGLDTALRVEADRMRNCAMDPKELAREKEVVLSELEGDENNPFNRLDQTVKATAFMAHPYHWPTIGWKSDVKGYTREAVMDYYRTHYQPNNAVVVIVGDFETDEVLPRVRELFGPIPRGPEPPRVVTQEPSQDGERRVTLKGESSAAYFMALYHIPRTIHADMYALSVLDSLLTVGKSSRLHRALVDAGLAADQTSELAQQVDPGWQVFYTTCPGNVDHAKFERAFDAVIAGVQQKPVGPAELAKAKRLSDTQVIFAMDGVSEQGALLGSYEIAAGWRYLTTVTNKTDQVTAEQVREVARKYLTADNRTIGWFVPTHVTKEKPAPIAKPGPIHRRIGGNGVVEYWSGGMLGRKQPLRRVINPLPHYSRTPLLQSSGLAALATLAPRAARVVLPNGMVVLLQENHANPTVALRGVVDAGGVFDPREKPGLANLVAATLGHGTATRSKAKFQEELDTLGAELTFDSSMDGMLFDGRCLSQDLARLLGLAHDAVCRPAFDPHEFARVRQEQLVALLEDEDSPYRAAMMDLRDALYPKGHPERHYARGTEESLRAIQRGDLLKFYRQHYRPDTTLLALVGDFDVAEARAQIEKLFGPWTAGGPRPRVELADIPEPDAEFTRAPLRLPIDEKSESIVVMGARGLKTHAPDYFAALAANHILGGGELLNSRLLTALREKRGLTYSVSSSFRSSRSERPWMLSMQNNPKNVDAAIAGVRAELERIRSAPPTEDELEQARAALVGELLLGMETNGGIGDTLRDVEFYGLGMDWLQRAVERIRALKPADVLAAARKYLPAPEKVITVIAGSGK
ncbi:MAG: insulinase family protein [Verrucomicrobia bacterium]|nr:insulinase family protein [Verrucomicrobiota bacterium]